MVELDGHRVAASRHAEDQALRRVPVLRGGDRLAASYWVEQTVARAVRDGRRARRCPRWCTRADGEGYARRGRAAGEGVVRFFWNEPETVAFVAANVADRMYGGRLWLVKTVIVPC